MWGKLALAHFWLKKCFICIFSQTDIITIEIHMHSHREILKYIHMTVQ